MCNLDSMTKGQKAIIDLTRAMIDQTGNLPPLPGIFPDYGAPIVREGPDGRELVLARWGMPSPLFALKGKKTDPGVTNIRPRTGGAGWSRKAVVWYRLPASRKTS
jgi:putative SOS response-associated peptidase YedK